ncbi:hypothetical protein [Roseobacter phage RDJL6]|nr:hypothetical protein [Roseobacter phage RDJL6]
MTWGGYASWSDTLLRGPYLVTPVRLLWQSYRQHCAQWGFDQAEASEFVHWLRGEEGMTLKTGGQGRVRRMAIGLAPSMVPDEAGGSYKGSSSTQRKDGTND